MNWPALGWFQAIFFCIKDSLNRQSKYKVIPQNEDLLFHTQKDEYWEDICDAERIRLVDENVLDEFQKYAGLSHIETCRALHCRFVSMPLIIKQLNVYVCFFVFYYKMDREILFLVRFQAIIKMAIHEVIESKGKE